MTNNQSDYTDEIDTRESFARERELEESYWRTPTWSQILPGLWMGGTRDDDKYNQHSVPLISKKEFDSVFTLYAFANPVDWFVKELRFGFMDSKEDELDVVGIKRIAQAAYDDWKRGEKVLIRCQAGLNRSGIVTALVLIKDGYEPKDAIELLRTQRHAYVLFNPLFEKWLLTQTSDW